MRGAGTEARGAVSAQRTILTYEATSALHLSPDLKTDTLLSCKLKSCFIFCPVLRSVCHSGALYSTFLPSMALLHLPQVQVELSLYSTFPSLKR